MSAPRPARGWEKLEVQALKSGVVHAGYGYWDGLRQGRPFPARSEISPRGAGSLLRHIAVLAVIDEPADYLFRIVGEEVAGAYGQSFNNKRVSEIQQVRPQTGDALKEILDEVRNSGLPYAFRNWLKTETTAETFNLREAVFLPLGKRAPVVDHILVVDAPV